MRYANRSVYDDEREPPAGAQGQLIPWLSQWFIDWRNAEAAADFVAATVDSTFLDGVDGTVTDDSQGAPISDPSCGTSCHQCLAAAAGMLLIIGREGPQKRRYFALVDC